MFKVRCAQCFQTALMKLGTVLFLCDFYFHGEVTVRAFNLKNVNRKRN